MIKVFGSEMLITTFIFAIVAIAILIHSNSLLKNADKKYRKKFLTLVGTVIYFNVAFGLFPDENIPIPMALQFVIDYSGGITACGYLFYFIKTEYPIIDSNAFKPKFLVITLILGFVCGFLPVYLYNQDVYLATLVFVLSPLLAGIYIIYLAGRFTFYKQTKIYRGYLYCNLESIFCLFALLCMLGLGISLLFGNYQLSEGICVNLSLYFTYGILVVNHLHNGLIDYPTNRENKFQSPDDVLDKFKEFGLTKREEEVLNEFIINPETTHECIAEKLYISPKTVSKHVSNLYKKMNIGTKEELLALLD